jgi:hypothetical protein
LLAGFLAFVGLQAALSLSVDCWFPQLRDPLYTDKVGRLYARYRSDGPPDRVHTVIMLGSSRTGSGLHGRMLEERLAGRVPKSVVALNLGVPAAGPVTEYLYLRRLLDEGIRPDLVLIEVLPPLLSGGPCEPPLEHHWLKAERLRPHEVAVVRHYGFPEAEVGPVRWTAGLVPAYGLRYAIMSRLAPSWVPPQYRLDWSRGSDPNGWCPPQLQDLTEEQRRAGVARTRGEYAEVLRHFRLGGPACSALDDLLALCRREGLPAALVLMPETTHFRSWYPPEAKAQLEAHLARLSAAHGVAVIDAREWVEDRDFTDGHHLLPLGAALFTDRLGREALPPLLCGGAR